MFVTRTRTPRTSAAEMRWRLKVRIAAPGGVSSAMFALPGARTCVRGGVPSAGRKMTGWTTSVVVLPLSAGGRVGFARTVPWTFSQPVKVSTGPAGPRSATTGSFVPLPQSIALSTAAAAGLDVDPIGAGDRVAAGAAGHVLDSVERHVGVGRAGVKVDGLRRRAGDLERVPAVAAV